MVLGIGIASLWVLGLRKYFLIEKLLASNE